MELEKGEWDNLEGTVVIYSKLKNFDNPGKPVKFNVPGKIDDAEFEDAKVFAIYLTTDIARFIDKFGLPEEAKEKMHNTFNHSKKKLEEMLNSAGISGKIKQKPLPAYSSNVYNITYKADLSEFVSGEDRLFMGDYSDAETCVLALNKGVEFYLFRLGEQIGRKAGINRAKPDEKIVPEKKYGDMPKEGFRQYMMSTFIVPLIDNLNYSRKDEFRNIRKKFFEFCKGSPVVKDAVELCIAIGSEKKNLGLIEAYADKIAAIKNEDYEAAAEIRDTIKRYEKEIKL